VIRKSSFLVAAVATLCGMFAGCQSSNENQESPFVTISQPSFVQAWDLHVPMHAGDSVRGIYYLDGAVHVLSAQNYDQAVKGESGELLYRNQVGTPDVSFHGAPTLVRDGIVFPTNHTLEYYTRSGNFVRSVDVKYNITNQAIGSNHDDSVYVGLDFNQGCLAQVDVTQDILPVQWTFLTFGEIGGAVGLSDGVIYCGSEDGKVRACLEDRTPVWTLLSPDDAFDTQSKVFGSIAVDNAYCYCSTDSGKVLCLDKNTGKLQWQFFSGQPLMTGPQVSDSGVYQYVPTQGLVAIDKSDKLTLGDQESVASPLRTARWTLANGLRVLSEDETYLYVTLATGGRSVGLAAVDKQTGQIAFQTQRTDIQFLTSQPKAALIYGATRSGLLVAFKPTLQPGSYGQLVDSQSPGSNQWQPHAR
jgi:outer membrane protein assembly factor BamB